MNGKNYVSDNESNVIHEEEIDSVYDDHSQVRGTKPIHFVRRSKDFSFGTLERKKKYRSTRLNYAMT